MSGKAMTFVPQRDRQIYLLMVLIACGLFAIKASQEGSLGYDNHGHKTSAHKTPTHNEAPQDAVFAGKTFSPVSKEAKAKGMKVGVGVLIHKGFSKFEGHSVSEGMYDSLAVMSSQIARFRPYMKHEVQQVAFLTNTSAEIAPLLRKLGWETRVLALPITPQDIRNPQIAKEIVTDGAIGIMEMLKLEPWRPSQLKMDLDLLLIVDTDIHFRQPFDQVYDWVNPAHTFGYTNGAWEAEKVNGGYIIIRPGVDSERDYHNIYEVLKEGDFRSGTGWKGLAGWTYGGRTMQGLLPYYYVYADGKDRATLINRCHVNNMVNSDVCKAVDAREVISNHFTGGCFKPWTCSGIPHKLCEDFTNQWWEDRAVAARYLGFAPSRRCPDGYEALGLHTQDWSLPRRH